MTVRRKFSIFFTASQHLESVKTQRGDNENSGAFYCPLLFVSQLGNRTCLSTSQKRGTEREREIRENGCYTRCMECWEILYREPIEGLKGKLSANIVASVYVCVLECSAILKSNHAPVVCKIFWYCVENVDFNLSGKFIAVVALISAKTGTRSNLKLDGIF